MKNILFITHQGDWGGAQKVLYLLLKHLDKTQVHPCVVAPEEGAFVDKVRALGITVFIQNISKAVLKTRGFKNSNYKKILKVSAASQRGLKQRIKDWNIDAVFSNTLLSFDGALAASSMGVPHVWFIHEILSRDPDLQAIHGFKEHYEMIEKYSDAVMTVSNEVYNELKENVSEVKMKIVNVGIEPAESSKEEKNTVREDLGVSKDKYLMTYAAHMSRRKNPVSAAQVMIRVMKQRENVMGLMVGEGHYKTLAMELVNNEKMENRIHFLGEREDADNIIAASDCLIVTSTEDPHPLVILEAMNAGIPTLAFECSGPLEMIRDGEDGFLAKQGDDRRLAEKIVRLIDDSELSAVIGKKAKEKFNQKYDIRHCVEKIERVLKNVELLDRNSRERDLWYTEKVKKTLRNHKQNLDWSSAFNKISERFLKK